MPTALRTPAAERALPQSDRRGGGRKKEEDDKKGGSKERLQVHSRRARMIRCDSVESRLASLVLPSLAYSLSPCASWFVTPSAGVRCEQCCTLIVQSDGLLLFLGSFIIRADSTDHSLL